MSGRQPQPRVPDPDEQLERQREQTTESTTQQIAAQTGGDPTQVFAEDDHWEKLSGFDIEREDVPDEIEELLKTELSNKYTLGNFRWDDWRRFGFWAENEIHTAIKEFPDPDSAVTGTDYHIMYGRKEGMGPGREHPNIKPPLTDEMERRLWSVADTKKAGMTGAVNSRFLRALTEITAVSRTEREERDDSGSLWERFKERL